MPDKELATKDVESLREESQQPRATGSAPSGMAGLLYYLAGGSAHVAPWWSPQRDQDLSAFWKNSDKLSGALSLLASKVVTVPVQVEPRDTSVKRHQEEAEDFTIRLNEESDFGDGWHSALSKWLEDYWCLAGPTRIHLGGDRLGETKPIAKMVKDKDEGPILSVDGDGSIVERRVTNWFKNPLNGREWWWISLEEASGHARDQRGGIFMTEDHPVLTEEGWLPARDIKPGMLVATGDPALNDKQKQMIVGSLLGDASMSFVRKRALLRFSHSVEQERWFEQKTSALKGFQWTGKNYHQSTGEFANGHGVAINSRASLGLNGLYDAFYPNNDGTKVVPRELVEESFSALFLATWYMDDGSYSRVSENCYTFYLWTNGFSKSDVQWLVDLLTSHGIKASRYTIRGKYSIIGISAEGSRKLTEMIGPYVPPSMRYKLPENAPEYDPETWELGLAKIYWDTVAVSRQRDYKSGSSYYGGKPIQTTYNLSVEGTETYIAAHTVVHNCSDNGGFFEIIGEGDKTGPIEGPALGVAHLDAQRCQRTGDPEYPVLYLKPSGGRSKFHYTRVAFASDMPSAREEMFGVGFSAISRAINSAQNLLDIATFKQEKLGSRPLRGILQGRGIALEALQDALTIAGEEMDNRGFNIFSQLALLADIPSEAQLDLLSLTSLPDGFDEETSTRLGMFTLALAFGVPIRWIWPAAISGATKADAMYQHIAGLGGGIGRVLKVLTMLLGGDPRGSRHSSGKFLPEHLKLSFDFQDDEQDRMRSEIQGKRAQTRTANLQSGVVSVRVSRERALSDGDLTQAQFEELELDDGRRVDGTSILGLFHDTHEPFLSWLDLGVPNPLATTANDAIDMLAEINVAAINVQDVLANSGYPATRKKARQALAALNQLKAMYAPLAQQSIQSEIFGRWGEGTPQEGALPAEGAEQAPEEQPAPELPQTAPEGEKKASTKDVGFNYGAGAGEIIGGELARGAGGRFVNIQQMMDQLRAGMIARMGGSETAQAVNSAAAKRAANRAQIAEALNMDPATFEGLAGMRTGETSPETEQALAEQGLATVNHDGSITMNSAGRSLLSAANSGDVDKAEAARAKATKPKPAKGGGSKPSKPSPEQVRQENLSESRDELAETLPPTDFDNLMRFSEGADIPVEQARRLAQTGLVEIDADGNPRMTTAGKRMVRAAEDGKIREAKDQLSHARDDVRDAMDRAEETREKAQSMMERASDTREKGDKQAARLREEAETIRMEIEDAQPDLELLRAKIAAENHPEVRAELQDELSRIQDRILEYQRAASEMVKAASEVIAAAEEQAATYENRAEEYRTQAKEIEASVGGGLGATLSEQEKTQIPAQESSILTKIASLLGIKQTLTPNTPPLPPFTDRTVPISEEEKEAALAAWRELEDVPPDILEAREASPIEMANAIEEGMSE